MLIIGHRGAKWEVAENTVASIQRCLDDDADMVEFDLRTTRDGVVVLNHGPFLIKTHGIYKSIARNNFATLRKLTEEKGVPLATLDEILDIVDDHKKLCIEIKRGSAVTPTLDILAKRFPSKNIQGEIFIESFYMHILRDLRKQWPHARLGFLFWHSWQLLQRRHKKIGFDALVLFAKWPLRHDVKRGRRLGLDVFAYGVHGEKIWQKALDAKIDAVVTNLPAEFVQMRNKTQKR